MTIRIRSMLKILSLLACDLFCLFPGKMSRNTRSSGGKCLDAACPSQFLHALVQRSETNAGFPPRRKSSPIVCYLQIEGFAKSDAHRTPASLGMLEDIRQGLAHNAIA